MSSKKSNLYVVVAVRGPKPKFTPISKAVTRAQAVKMVQDEWSKGVMARIVPPLGKPQPAKKEVVVEVTA